jgi:hypothetical protein
MGSLPAVALPPELLPLPPVPPVWLLAPGRSGCGLSAHAATKPLTANQIQREESRATAAQSSNILATLHPRRARGCSHALAAQAPGARQQGQGGLDVRR